MVFGPCDWHLVKEALPWNRTVIWRSSGYIGPATFLCWFVISHGSIYGNSLVPACLVCLQQQVHWNVSSSGLQLLWWAAAHLAWVYFDFWGSASQNHDYERRSGGAPEILTTLGSSMCTDVAEYAGLNISPPLKCSCCNWDSISRPSISSRVPWPLDHCGRAYSTDERWAPMPSKSMVATCQVYHKQK